MERGVIIVKLGHVFLFVVYASGFAISNTISKDIFYSTDVQHMSVQQRCQNTANSVSNFIADKIGMNEFFDKLNEGM